MENGEILVSSWGVPPPFPRFSPKSRESTACGLDGIVMFQYHSFGGDFFISEGWDYISWMYYIKPMLVNNDTIINYYITIMYYNNVFQ